MCLATGTMLEGVSSRSKEPVGKHPATGPKGGDWGKEQPQLEMVW